MITDAPPRSARARRQFEQSDALDHLDALPDAVEIRSCAAALESALATGDPRNVQKSADAILALLAKRYAVGAPKLRVLGARPRSVWEGGHSELFGDYDFAARRIRIWMRTAVFGKVTSFRGLLHTLLHEFCHHLDREALGFPDTPHTRGFHARVDDLYHLALATPPEKRRPLAWVRMGRVFRIDWTRMKSRPTG